ncbi:MAG: T9SS type A sorting domain-containing protein [Saprospiraceae bacterium]|nr:T9SS type A sorting domain-containing protein [Saprospiraceae bacterium]
MTADVELGGSSVYGMYEIIEDIGSLFGLFGHFYIITAEDWRYQFLCYKNESYIYPDENSCSPTSSSDVDKYNFILSPNPVADVLLVTLGEYIPQHGMIHIHDATGRVVMSQRLYYGHNHLDMTALSTGLYFWTAEDNGVRIKGGKVIKL